MLTKFEVEDFPRWKAVFLAAESIRTAAGAKNVQIFQGSENSNMLMVITEWDSLEKAKAFSQSPGLREAQQKSGLLSKPEVFELKSM